MVVINCKICGAIHKVTQPNTELCLKCITLHEAQYKLILGRLEKLTPWVSLRDVVEKTGYEPQRVQVYMLHRFGKPDEYVYLDGYRRGFCYICDFKIYHPVEEACLDCLQKIVAAVENRNLNHHSRMGTGRIVNLKVLSLETPEGPLEEDNLVIEEIL